MTSRLPQRLPQLLGLAAITATILAGGARADAIPLSDFTLAGSASAGGGGLILTQANVQQSAGSAFVSSPYTLGAGGSFSASFQFQITPGSNGPADGFTFVLANSLASNPLSAGGNLGYYGFSNSVAIEFDTYDNGTADIATGGTNDTNDNNIGIDVNGLLTGYAYASPYGVGSTSAWACNGTSNPTGCMANGDIWTVLIGYQDGKLSVSVQDGTNAPDLVISDYAIDIPGLIGTDTPYIGFTGSDGGDTSGQVIAGLSLSSDGEYAPPAPVPEPASLALLGTGILGLIAWRRRRAQSSR